MGQHVKGLEDEAQLVPAQTGQRVFIEPGVGAAVEGQRAAVGPVEAGDEVEQRGFADAGLTDDGHVFAGR